MEHIIIIGGGIGGALAHDLTQRGFTVSLVERGELLSGTTGRHHGLLHSGARYVLHDPTTARECWVENQILKKIAPDALEKNDGLFVALNDTDMSHYDRFIAGCDAAGIPATPINRKTALALEPNLDPNLKAAVIVPDAAMDAWRLPLHFFASAKSRGADIRTFSEVVEIIAHGNSASGVKIFDHRTQRTYRLKGDLLVNAAGPWAGKIATMLDIPLPVKPGPGVMVSVGGRLTNMVINRLHPADDGDIIVPQRNLSILGTTVWLGKDPDRIDFPHDQIQQIQTLCAHMVPKAGTLPIHAAWSAARPLIVRDKNEDPTKISRSFDCIDHAKRDGVEGLISLVGGKATTMRAMAEEAADLICAKTGRNITCGTRETPLLPYRCYYK
jgi:glycerol-3-phosphate dehydrogenase